MHIEHITTLDQPALRDYARLTDVALRVATEPQGGLYIAESITVIGRALRAGHVPRSVLTTRRWIPDLEALLGDHDVPHLIPEPDVHLIIVEDTDEFLILATDGIWDVMDDQMAVNICRQMHTVQEMSEALVRAALTMGTEDNCSALIIALN